MVEMVRAAVTDLGVDDRIVAAGEFNPRGTPDRCSSAGSPATTSPARSGSPPGRSAHGASGTSSAVCRRARSSASPTGRCTGSPGDARSSTGGLVFNVDRSAVRVEVHQRVNVRIVELIDEASGSRIELEGNRLPVTPSKDVIDHLR
jgi:hypothetical protein